MAKWSEYFQKLLNVPGNIEPEVLENLQKRSVNTALDEKPTMDEMVKAIKGLKDGKAPGGDGINDHEKDDSYLNQHQQLDKTY